MTLLQSGEAQKTQAHYDARMQAYLAVQNSSLDTLIVRKRIRNQWWGGRDMGDRALRLVNQAGQWALPGGAADARETPVAAALREFAQETGEVLKEGTDGQVTAQHTAALRYTLVCFRYKGDLATLAATITDNCTYKHTRAGGGGVRVGVESWGPKKAKIRDWELSAAEVVAQSLIKTRLGVYDDKSGAPAPLPGDDSQKVEWYAAMAETLATTGASTFTISGGGSGGAPLVETKGSGGGSMVDASGDTSAKKGP